MLYTVIFLVFSFAFTAYADVYEPEVAVAAQPSIVEVSVPVQESAPEIVVLPAEEPASLPTLPAVEVIAEPSVQTEQLKPAQQLPEQPVVQDIAPMTITQKLGDIVPDQPSEQKDLDNAAKPAEEIPLPVVVENVEEDEEISVPEVTTAVEESTEEDKNEVVPAAYTNTNIASAQKKTTKIGVKEEQTKTVVVTNAITETMLQYKHWTGTYTPDFNLTVNGNEISQGKQTMISIGSAECTFAYHAQFPHDHTSEDTVTCVVAQNTKNITVEFDWQQLPHIVLRQS
jgi:hypothetical protein